MKHILLLTGIIVTQLATILFPQKASANHAAGGEIIYIYKGDSAYQFILKFYRDCRGPAAPSSFNLCVFNTCTNTSFTVPMTQWQGTLPPDNRPQGSRITPGCSGTSTTCENTSATVPGYEEWWYTCDINNLPLKCNYWKFGCIVGTTALCCRNASNNLVGTPNFYIETTFNSNVPSAGRTEWDNSSPYYSVKPIPYVCLNRPYTYNNGAIDADGDSLSSQMINPLASANCSVTPTLAPLQTLIPPINFNTNPFPTNNTFNLNAGNGQMTFTASQVGAGTLTIRTREFRKNINNVMTEIGSIMRDVQVQVLACSTVQPVLNVISVDSGILANGLVYGCVGQTLDFCFNVSSSDTDAVLIASDNLNLAIPAATMAYSGQRTDTVKGCFQWTPTINDAGRKHSFVVLIKDSTCKPPGILLQYAQTVELYIWGHTVASPDTSICAGEPAFLGVTGGGDYQWSVISGSSPSLSNPFIANPVATPAITTTYLVTSTLNYYCPAYNKDTVVISVLQGPEITNQPDDTTCPNFNLGLDVAIINKDPNATYTINWSPAAGLSNTTIGNPTVKIKKSTQYTIEVASNINRCKTIDTVFIDVLTGHSVENPDTMICFGQSVDIRAKGDPRYFYEWESKNDDPAATFTDPAKIATTVTPAKIGKSTYFLHAKFPKCQGVDSMASFEIDVQPVPTVTVDDDASICYGDTMQLRAVVNPATYTRYTYNWIPGATLDFPDRTNPIFSAVTIGLNSILFVANTPAGCSDTDIVNINVFSPEFLFVPGDTAICPGDSISLNMTTQSAIKYHWQPDFNISSVSSMQPRVWPVTDQLYTVYGVDALGCLDTAEIKVTVNQRAVLDLPDSASIYYGEFYQMDPGGNCLYYSWFPPLDLSSTDISNPIATPKVNTRYIVHARTHSGCYVTDSIDLIVKADVFITVPNAFTPGKSNNGVLKVLKRGYVELKKFAVYNRWGEKVFETNNINEGWDGTYNGEMQPVGVYVYTVEAIANQGRKINQQGNVTILR